MGLPYHLRDPSSYTSYSFARYVDCDSFNFICEVLMVVVGHDFYVIGAGAGTFNSSTAVFNLDNPPRRDVAILQNSGWLALAWQTDNPGAWLMHCHVGWHTLEGFALQFLEMEDEIYSNNLIDSDVLSNTCSSWNSYTEDHDVVQGPDGVEDSGI